MALRAGKPIASFPAHPLGSAEVASSTPVVQPTLANPTGAAPQPKRIIGSGAQALVINAPIVPLRLEGPDSLRGKVPGSFGGPPITELKATTLPRLTTLSLLGNGETGGISWPVPPGTTLQDLADMGHLNDDTILQLLQQQTISLLSTTNLYQDVQNIWNDVLNGLKEGALKGVEIGTTVAVIDVALADLGFTALADVLAGLVADIAAAITAAIAEAGGTAIVAGVAGGSTFGYVGAIIGAIIGACIALGNVLYGGQHCEITDGRTFSCKDYVSTNIPNASQWLQNNPEKLKFLTAKRFAEQAALFLANPTWLAVNQGLLGISQPNPPDPGTGDALDMVYTQVPGAYELLNRAQFAAAITFCTASGGTADPASGGRLKDCATIPNPLPGQAKFYGDTSGTPYGQQGVKGQGVYPDPDPSKYGLIYATKILTWTPGDAGLSHGTMIPGSNQIPSMWQARYAAPPNLLTNGNTYSGTWPDGQGKISGQTDIAPGIYMIQVMFPTLTTAQAEMIFDRAENLFGPVPSLMGNVAGSGSGILSGPLLTGGLMHPPPAPPPPVFSIVTPPPSYRFGPGSLSGLNLGSWGTGLAALSAINAGQKPTAPVAPPPAIVLPPNAFHTPPTSIPIAAPVPPSITLGQAQAGLGTPGFVAGTLASSASGHPLGIANGAVVTLAARLATQAKFVARFVSVQAGEAILSGAHLAR